MRNPIRRGRLAVLVLAALGLITVSAGWVIATSPGDVVARQEVSDLAVTALSSEGDVNVAADHAALAARYTGDALLRAESQLSHVQDLIREGTDYPGSLHVSQLKILSVAGGTDSYTVEVQFHAVRDNMKAGRLIDQSESDVIWDVTVIRTQDGWRISQMQGRFAPGGGP